MTNRYAYDPYRCQGPRQGQLQSVALAHFGVADSFDRGPEDNLPSAPCSFTASTLFVTPIRHDPQGPLNRPGFTPILGTIPHRNPRGNRASVGLATIDT